MVFKLDNPGGTDPKPFENDVKEYGFQTTFQG